MNSVHANESRKHSGCKPTLGQVEIYKYLKGINDEGLQAKQEDIINIYKQFVRSNKNQYSFVEETRERDYPRASDYLHRAISSLVRHGWLDLIFKKEIKEIKELEGTSN